MLRKYVVGLLVSLLLVLLLVAVATAAGTAAPVIQEVAPVPDLARVQVESCSVCHKDAGDKHQASYDQLYQDGVIVVTDIAYAFTAPDTTVVSFKMAKNGKPFDAKDADSIGIYFAPFTGEKFQFDDGGGRMSLMGDLACDAEGCTSTKVGAMPDLTEARGMVVIYGADETVGRLPARIRQVKYPFVGILQMGEGVDYVSAANNDGCEKCHTDPYLKHGYIYAQVDGDPGTDFYACKACHLDNGNGGHLEWQLLVDDPALAAAVMAEEVVLTPEQEAQYAYKTTLMNDVHMSHAMEFPYPQSMSNCVTCHAGKLDVTLADVNFTLETCKSCHPVNGSEEYGTAEASLAAMLNNSIHNDLDLATADCTECHVEGGDGPVFSEIHTGYNSMIYTADGLKYADAISVTIDSASFDGAMLTIGFSAAEEPDIEGLDVADILPTVMVGLYGWDTKDFIIGAHERLNDDNGDGAIDRNDNRALEAEAGAEHPRFTTTLAEGGKWEMVADMSNWIGLVEAGTVSRVEIGVMPELVNADEVQLALNAPSRTFDLTTNSFVDDFYSPLVRVADGCNNCHEALATTFHSPDRGGNIVVCRMCHITKSGGSHLEMQSRSIDSYAHAVHSFQAFDIGDVNFEDPVEAMHYEHHIEFPYPTHGVTNCESCHVEGVYNVPDQSKSLPGLLSGSDAVETWDRNIGTVPVYATGPASRACGACHRAELINEDHFSELLSFNQHTNMGGYMVPGGEDARATLMSVIEQIMAWFK